MTSPSYVIRIAHPELVLDATETQVKIQIFTGSPSQLWTLELAERGTLYIINKGNGKVLDIIGGVIPHADIITHPIRNGPNQQWYINSDKTIVSSIDDLAVDIVLDQFVPGTRTIAYPKHGKMNQLFVLEKQ